MGEADQGTTQCQERLMEVHQQLVPNRQSPIAIEPGQRPLDHPAAGWSRCPVGNLDPVLGAAQHAAEGDRQDVEQLVASGARDAGIDEVDEGVGNPRCGMGIHGGVLGAGKRAAQPCPPSPKILISDRRRQFPM